MFACSTIDGELFVSVADIAVVAEILAPEMTFVLGDARHPFMPQLKDALAFIDLELCELVIYFKKLLVHFI